MSAAIVLPRLLLRCPLRPPAASRLFIRYASKNLPSKPSKPATVKANAPKPTPTAKLKPTQVAKPRPAAQVAKPKPAAPAAKAKATPAAPKPKPAPAAKPKPAAQVAKPKPAALVTKAKAVPAATKPKLKPASATKPNTVPAVKPKPTVQQQAAKELPRYATLEEELGHRPHPTLLYDKYPTSFIFGCYGVALGGLAWCVYTYQANIAQPSEGLPGWVTRVHWTGIGMMVVFVVTAGYFPTRIVQKIYALPAAKRSQPATVKIELHRRPFLPLLPLHKIVIDSPHEIWLDGQLRPMNVPPPPSKEPRMGALGLEQLPQSPIWEWVDLIKSLPRRIFAHAKRTVTTEEFAQIRILDGSSYWLHKEGWVWEPRGLEQLFALRKHGGY